MAARRPSAQELMELLRLEPLPGEGGHFVRTHAADRLLAPGCLPPGYETARPLSTAILYLLAPGDFSALHRLPTDELLHFHLGDPSQWLILHPDGRSETLTLGPDILAGQMVQAIMPRGSWFGGRLAPGGEYALLGATLAPGFDWPDMILAQGPLREMTDRYPDRAGLIEDLWPQGEGR